MCVTAIFSVSGRRCSCIVAAENLQSAVEAAKKIYGEKLLRIIIEKSELD